MSRADEPRDRAWEHARHDRAGGRELRFRIWQQLPLLAVLVVLWMLVWGELSLLSFTTGVIVALVVPIVFYLPPVELPGRVNPWHLLVFLITFGAQVAAGSITVSASAFGPRIRRNAVIEVPLRTESDFILTLTGIAVSLVPGSLILEIDRYRATLYVHVLNTRTDQAVEDARRHVLDLERRIVLAVGSRADVERIRS